MKKQLNELVEKWTLKQNPEDIMTSLQKAGVGLPELSRYERFVRRPATERKRMLLDRTP